MSKYLQISIIILVLFVGYAPSCVDEEAIAIREEAILTEARNDIRTEFETDYLTEASLFAYEATAKQKLSDIADYFHILTDTSLDLSFRTKADEMIQSSFMSEDVLHLAPLEGYPVGESNIQTLVEEGLTNEPPIPPFSFDSIFILEPIHRTGDRSYSGTLKFKQIFSDPTGSGLTSIDFRRKADFHLIKEEKIFGPDTLRVWNVRLGEIR